MNIIRRSAFYDSPKKILRRVSLRLIRHQVTFFFLCVLCIYAELAFIKIFARYRIRQCLYRTYSSIY